jgi:hypothetical protein
MMNNPSKQMILTDQFNFLAMSENNPKTTETGPEIPKKPHFSQAGDGLRSLKSTTAFRAINFELYVKPVSVF